MSSAKQETRIPELAAAGKDGVCGGQGKEVITDGSQRERKSRIALSRRQMKPSEQSVDPLRSEPCQQPDYRRIEGVAQSRGRTDPSHIGCIVIAGGVVAVTQGRVIKNGFRDENPAA